MDETMDLSRREQLSVFVRYVDENLNIFERFLGFCNTNNPTSSVLSDILNSIFQINHFDYRKYLIGHCCDGDASMSGKRIGLNVKIKENASKSLYVHCYAH